MKSRYGIVQEEEGLVKEGLALPLAVVPRDYELEKSRERLREPRLVSTIHDYQRARKVPPSCLVVVHQSLQFAGSFPLEIVDFNTNDNNLNFPDYLTTTLPE